VDDDLDGAAAGEGPAYGDVASVPDDLGDLPLGRGGERL